MVNDQAQPVSESSLILREIAIDAGDIKLIRESNGGSVKYLVRRIFTVPLILCGLIVVIGLAISAANAGTWTLKDLIESWLFLCGLAAAIIAFAGIAFLPRSLSEFNIARLILRKGVKIRLTGKVSAIETGFDSESGSHYALGSSDRRYWFPLPTLPTIVEGNVVQVDFVMGKYGMIVLRQLVVG